MTNNTNGISTDITIDNKKPETVCGFQCLGAIVSDEGSKPEVLSRIAQTTAAVTKLKVMWNVDHNSRHYKKDTGTGDRYLVKRSHKQWGSESQNWKRHQAVWRPHEFSEKTKTELARAHHTIIWTGQDYSTGNSSRRETKRQSEETMGRQHGIYHCGKPRAERSGESWL